jgi:hypothetical protein
VTGSPRPIVALDRELIGRFSAMLSSRPSGEDRRRMIELEHIPAEEVVMGG